jgi:hypothetical protein
MEEKRLAPEAGVSGTYTWNTLEYARIATRAVTCTRPTSVGPSTSAQEAGEAARIRTIPPKVDATARLRGHHGLTLIELLVGALITAMVAAGGFHFYAKFHHLGESQSNISELQGMGQNTLRELRKTFRMAGFNLDGHPPYELKGDTVAIYYSQTQAVDTVLYYLEEFTSAEYAALPGRPAGMYIYNLMRQINSTTPVLFTDFVSSVNVVPIDARNVAITVTVQANRADDKYVPNEGFRTYSIGERVLMRNVT